MPDSCTRIALSPDNTRALSDLSIERIWRPLVEDLVASIAEHAPRRAEMTLALLKRILRAAEERGQPVDPPVYAVRIARPPEREPRFLTWEEADELRSWMPEYIARIVPVAILTLLRRGEIPTRPRRRLRDGRDLGLRSGPGR